MPYYNPYLNQQNNYTGMNPQQFYNNLQAQQNQYMQQQVQNNLIYVHGIDGANAYQMPVGVNQVILWDDTDDSFYVKAYDNTGKPKVIAWNDYKTHEVKELPKEAASSIDTSKFLTKDDLEKIISQLRIGDQGRIVRSNEHDA